MLVLLEMENVNVILFDDVAFSSLFFEILETKSYNINF